MLNKQKSFQDSHDAILNRKVTSDSLAERLSGTNSGNKILFLVLTENHETWLKCLFILVPKHTLSIFLKILL